MDYINRSVAVLFISARRSPTEINEISKDSIIGVMPGVIIIQILNKRFAFSNKIFRLMGEPEMNIENMICSGFHKRGPMRDIFAKAYGLLTDFHNRARDRESLKESDITNWFGAELASRVADIAIGPDNIQTIRQALAQGDKFLICTKEKQLYSVISICTFTKSISKRVLSDILKAK
jgi:hypothetical protein